MNGFIGENASDWETVWSYVDIPAVTTKKEQTLAGHTPPYRPGDVTGHTTDHGRACADLAGR